MSPRHNVLILILILKFSYAKTTENFQTDVEVYLHKTRTFDLWTDCEVYVHETTNLFKKTFAIMSLSNVDKQSGCFVNCNTAEN